MRTPAGENEQLRAHQPRCFAADTMAYASFIESHTHNAVSYTHLERIELIPTAAAPAKRKRPSASVQAEGQRKPAVVDRISKQCILVKKHYKLSEREAEVMELIARGATVARIAEMLTVSENTVRTHSKRIYAKLDIHRKQELADLVDSFDPRTLE